MAKPTALVIWMNGHRVGTWSHVRGKDTLAYDADWVASPAGRPLSLSLPFTPQNRAHTGDVVANYFDNLLPDSDRIRSRLRSKLGTASTGAFDLLQSIGRDCAGAVQLLPADQEPEGWDRIDGQPLDNLGVEAEIAAMLSGSRAPGRTDEMDFRISIAGAQEKTALLYHRGRWCRPRGATPTTHILKLPLGLVGALQMDLHDSLENEWLCLQLLAAYGLPTARCELLRFGDRRVLAVERFDRARVTEGWIARLPQEDFCQAMGLPSTLKYESDGGPGMAQILRVLDVSTRALADKRAFVKAQILFWLLAAPDGHAKNFSLFIERGGTHRLTPFYDVLSAWPIMGRGPYLLDPHKAKLAMAVRSKSPHWKLQDIRPRHWDAVARAAGLGDGDPLLGEIAIQTSAAIAAVTAKIPPGFPAAVQDRILEGLRRSVSQLA